MRAAIAFQIYLEKITGTLAPYQNNFLESQMVLKEPKSFGYWSPRRCDVYVVSFHPGYLQDRLDIVADLWNNNISADLMYDAGLPTYEYESAFDVCAREGIL